MLTGDLKKVTSPPTPNETKCQSVKFSNFGTKKIKKYVLLPPPPPPPPPPPRIQRLAESLCPI